MTPQKQALTLLIIIFMWGGAIPEVQASRTHNQIQTSNDTLEKQRLALERARAEVLKHQEARKTDYLVKQELHAFALCLMIVECRSFYKNQKNDRSLTGLQVHLFGLVQANKILESLRSQDHRTRSEYSRNRNLILTTNFKDPQQVKELWATTAPTP